MSGNLYVSVLAEYLNTYDGRDKFLRTLSYAAKFASGFPRSPVTAEKWQIFGSRMSGCRVILRLLDDIPNVHSAITYSWGRAEPDWFIRIVDLIRIVVNLVYGPVEHICWAGENNLISINVKQWGTRTIWFWIVSLYLALIKSMRKYKILKNQEVNYNKNGKDHGYHVLKEQQHNELLICTRLMLDLTYAVNYLPPGTLWGGKLASWKVGALGTISSFIALYQTLAKKLSQNKS